MTRRRTVGVRHRLPGRDWAGPIGRLALVSWVGLASACAGGNDAAATKAPPPDGRLFTRLPASYSGVAFTNRVTDTREVNVFTYRNHYNGGGVAIGDLTGDGLPELVLTANERGPTLYLNRGAFRFRDVTEASGIRFNGAWTTGVTMADVNGDGRLDVYVCHAGRDEGRRRANELYINQGVDADSVPTFREMAAALGVADGGYSTQAAFLDYDRDGDLDLFLINNSPRAVSSFGLKNNRNVRDSLGGAKLYRNDGDSFADVSAAAGIYGSEIGFGLGIAVGDVNRDGWPDVYVSNDFFEHDYLYVNRGNGTFEESIEGAMPYSSYFSMGLDISDADNDGWPDVYTTDMLPEDEYRLRTTSSFEGWDVYQAKVQNGYGYQFMRNMLQLNRGNGAFSDIGQIAGVARTDWSWSALLADLDLDGNKDIFVTNGLAKDVTSQDYITSLANQAAAQAVYEGKQVDYLKLVDAMSSTRIPNYALRNHGDSTFTNEAAAWGLDTPAFSNGAAYGDLDGDGALDLVVNNVNDEAFIYRNNVRTLKPANRYLQVKLTGTGANRFGVGARVAVWGGGAQFVQELHPTRGFQSSVDYTLTFGVGTRDTVDSVVVVWPDARSSVLRQVATNQRITVRHTESAPTSAAPGATPAPLLADVSSQAGIDFVHRENDFVDFDRERLIPKLVSTDGPALAVADVNGDGLDDVFLGGAREQAGEIFVQRRDGRFVRSNAGLFAPDSLSEDVGAVFFDADGDRHPDLYVVSGGSEYSDGASALQDRLYLNDGRGTFHKASDAIPVETTAGSRAAAADYDGDGDVDLFVGGRVVPWHYGAAPKSQLLRNNGRGRFDDVTSSAAPELARAGMVTDATWQDVDKDGRLDLVVVGDWMPMTIFRNAGSGRLARLNAAGLEKSHGWWNRIAAGDFTGDGRVDFLVGNLGLNTRLHASATEPATMAVKDFDGNGADEQIVATYSDGRSYPLPLRDEIVKAIPPLKARYFNYRDYATQAMADVFPAADLQGAVLHSAYTFATSLVRNNGDGSFTMVPLPREAQFAPVWGIVADDLDGDGRADVLLAGNFDGVKPDIGRLSASYGLLLHGDGKGSFTPVRTAQSGVLVPGQTRDLQRVRTATGYLYVAARNNDRPVVLRPARQLHR